MRACVSGAMPLPEPPDSAVETGEIHDTARTAGCLATITPGLLE